MEPTLKHFLESLSRTNNSAVMETVLNGYKCIFEGYADVVDIESIDATTRFNQMAAYNASLDGNNILSFLQRSSERIASQYSVDDEPELDLYSTSTFNSNSYNNPVDLDHHIDAHEQNINPRSFENNLGLTAQDMKDLF